MPIAPLRKGKLKEYLDNKEKPVKKVEPKKEAGKKKGEGGRN
jgi:hypothetical protein